MTADQRAQIRSVVATTMALSEAIRELGSVPAGHLYAQVMSFVDLPTFDGLIGVLVESGLVARDGHLLVWKGTGQ